MKKYFILLAFIVTWKMKIPNHEAMWSESSQSFSFAGAAADFANSLFINPDVVEITIKQVEDK